MAKDEDDDNIVSMADVKTIFKDLDNDGDGNVELDEFLVNKILVWERCQSDAFDSTEILGWAESRNISQLSWMSFEGLFLRMEMKRRTRVGKSIFLKLFYLLTFDAIYHDYDVSADEGLQNIKVWPLF